jgi:hypothetical protein
MGTILAMFGAVYFLCVAVGLAGILLAIQRRARGIALVLAAGAILVSGMGLTSWTPVGSFPEIGYSWSNGRLEIAVRSSWLFALPLMLGLVALILTLMRGGPGTKRQPPPT